MAVVATPLALNVIRTFRGSLDFYYWKGRGVCRKWPRRAKQPDSPAQLRARANFARMITILQALPEAWHHQWKNVDLPKGRSYTDLKRKHVLWLLAAGYWHEPPNPIGYLYQHQTGTPTAQIYITTTPFKDPTAAAYVQWLYRDSERPEERFKYEDFLPAKTREHYYYYQTKPLVQEYHLPKSQSYDPTRNMWTIEIEPTVNYLSLMAKPIQPEE